MTNFTFTHPIKALVSSLCLLLCSLFIITGCSDSSPTDNDDSNTDPNGNNGNTEITAEKYIQATIDGTVVTNQDKNDLPPFITLGGRNTGTDAETKEGYMVIEHYYFVRLGFQGSGAVYDTTYRSIGIAFIKVFESFWTKYDTYYDLAPYGSVRFGSMAKEEDGVEITWTDESGKMWSSAKGSANQTGSKFTISQREEIEYLPGQIQVGDYKLGGTFNCTLYDDFGNSLKVINGKFAITGLYRGN